MTKRKKPAINVAALLDKRAELVEQLEEVNKALADKLKFIIFYYTDVYHTELCRKTIKAADEREAVEKFYAWQRKDLRFGGQGCGGYYKPARIKVVC